MSTDGIGRPATWCMRAVVVALLLTFGTPAAIGQDDASKVPTIAAPKGAESTEAAKDESTTKDEPTTVADDSKGTSADEQSKSAADTATQPSGAPAPAGTAPSAVTTTAPTVEFNWKPVLYGVAILAMFIVPVMLGNYIAGLLRMPDYGWKIGLVLLTVFAATLVVSLGEFKFGPDLAGGITLVYELEDTAQVLPTTTTGQAQPGAAVGTTQVKKVDMSQLIAALRKRVDPTSTQEITIREQGGTAIEIIIPKTSQDALDAVKHRITALGQLEFRITADPRQSKDRQIIEAAKLLPAYQKDVMLGGLRVAEWVPYDEHEFGSYEHEDNRQIVKRMAGDTPEALVLIDPWNVTGEYLTSATKGFDGQTGGPAVHFTFDSLGARRFQQLTGQNLPNPATGAERYLGILLDNRLVSAPGIHSTISNQGQISGGAMNDKEVEDTVNILNAGSLPAALNKTPISEEIISPTLGAATIQKGKLAIVISFLAIVVFMQLYYRLAGTISIIALFINLLLVLALMVLIRAAFTLPGLAGLVLTIGIAVDANVLIFERMREELRHGAALRMAIRNGFGRATRTIIDANMTTIIAGVVMYAVGRDQIKGFAITLILGILVSMYTAIFCSRIIFDILERKGWITTLKMNSIIGHTNVDFMSWRYIAIGASWVLIAIGFVGVYFRGGGLFNIDFTGGSSVSFAFDEAHARPISDVQAALDGTELVDRNLLIVRNGESDTRYTVSTSDQSVDHVKEIIVNTFGQSLLNYSVDFSDVQPFDESGLSGTVAKLLVNDGPGYDKEDGISHDALMDRIKTALTESGESSVSVTATNPNFRPGSAVRYKKWDLRFVGMKPDAVAALLEKLKTSMEATPMFPVANKIGGRVSKQLSLQALYAIALSCLGIILYLWLRFQQVTFGLAAVIALLHDVLITIGMVALSAYFVELLPSLAKLLKIDSFQISLDIVAALLTIIGYSVNDTIIVFDRLREVRGKSPELTKHMINLCVNQTLSRTILTAFTVFLVVAILYWFGGEGVHGFAFCMLIGVFVGCYSSIYIAAPILYWLVGSPEKDGEALTLLRARRTSYLTRTRLSVRKLSLFGASAHTPVEIPRCWRFRANHRWPLDEEYQGRVRFSRCVSKVHGRTRRSDGVAQTRHLGRRAVTTERFAVTTSRKLLLAGVLLAGGYGLALLLGGVTKPAWLPDIVANAGVGTPSLSNALSTGAQLAPLTPAAPRERASQSLAAQLAAGVTPAASWQPAAKPKWLAADTNQNSIASPAPATELTAPGLAPDERGPRARITEVTPSLTTPVASTSSPWDRWPPWEPNSATAASAVTSADPSSVLPRNSVSPAHFQSAGAPASGAMQASFEQPRLPSSATTPIAGATVGADANAHELRTHIVIDGDSLSSLAGRYLHDPQLGDEIFRLNRDVLSAPELLPIGVELRIPDGRVAISSSIPGTTRGVDAANASASVATVRAPSAESASPAAPRAQILRPVPASTPSTSTGS